MMAKPPKLPRVVTPVVTDSKYTTPQRSSFNSFPRNWRAGKEEDFWKDFSIFGFGVRQEYRQMINEKNIMTAAHLIFYDGGSGWGIVLLKDTPWFYQFNSCDHRYEATASGKQWQKMTCSRCQHVYTVDSSG